VEEEFKNYEVKKLARSFMSLKSCMIKVMEAEGVIGYDIPHMGKDRLEAEGRLEEVMDDLSISANVLQKTKDLIVQYIKQAAEEASNQHQAANKQAKMETGEASSSKKHAKQASKKKGKQVSEASSIKQVASKQANQEEQAKQEMYRH
jgi:hypothetical protein